MGRVSGALASPGTADGRAGSPVTHGNTATPSPCLPSVPICAKEEDQCDYEA